MDRVEVLVAAMKQKDLFKYRQMNIQTDAVIANQAERTEYIEKLINGKAVKMITTAERGVGINRNMALMYSSADICLLSDDDVVYVEGYEKTIIKAFEKIPEADVIIFNINNLNKERADPEQIKKIHRVRLYNFIRYGAPNIAFRRKSIMRKNVWFSLLFGGGTEYSAGEDSLFLRDIMKKGLKIYAFPEKIADVENLNSTWFAGHSDKFLFDHGAWLSASFPVLKYLGLFFYMFKFRHTSKLSYIKILGLMISGMKSYKNGITYNEWRQVKYGTCMAE